MTFTISGTLNTLVALGSATYNPTTITAAGRLNDGVEVSYPSLTMVNAGTIASGSLTAGVELLAGGSITNQGGASITGEVGIYAENAAVSVVNAGNIAGYGYPGAGIFLRAGGSVTNQKGGSIGGGLDGAGQFGIRGENVAVTVVNAGIIATNGVGIRLQAGGSVTNQGGGTISAAFAGINGYSSVAITVVNAGSISGPDNFGFGIVLPEGSSLTNESGGSISGYNTIYGNGAATVVNAGYIVGTSAAVRFAAGFVNRLVVDPNAVFSGLVTGGNTIGATSVSTLELASGASVGTLTGIGTQFVDFAQTTIDAAASWTLTGGNSFAAGTTLTNAGTLTVLDTTLSDAGLVVNNGLIQIDPSTVTLASLNGTGSVAIDSGGTLDILGTVSAGQTIVFNGDSDLLGLNPTAYAGQIDGFTVGDTIDLTGVTDGLSPGIVNGNTLQIDRTFHPAVDLTLDPGVTYAGDSYAVSPEGAVTEAPCFLSGTLIRTEIGEVMVQDLAVGDRVLTLSGQIRPIVWIGTGRVLVSPGRRSAATPVIVRRGALADNIPRQNLHITKGHALFVDGALIPVEFLINHRSILWDDDQHTVAFYHIELDTHDVLLANGAPAESYRDDGNRWLFQNANSGWHLPPTPPCAPVLTGGSIVDTVWHQLLDRAGPRPLVTLTDDPDLHVLVDGSRVDATTRTEDIHVFDLPRTRTTVRIVSRAAAPQELGLARDPRRLGVALQRIIVRKMTRFRLFDAADKRLTDGFHAFESDNGLRWTDGYATLPAALFDGFAGALELVLHLGGSTRYPTFVRAAARVAA